MENLRDKESIGWGIVGCGDVCEVKSGPGFQRADHSRLVAVMRRDGGKAQDFARRHGVPHWSNYASAVIENPEVDAVYIATPPGSHMEYALQVCAAGKPCYVEKPMARNGTECQTMNAAFARAGLSLFVAFYRRALPRFLKAKELLESGRLGQLTGVNYRFAGPTHDLSDPDNQPWRVDAATAGGGHFLDLGCHTLDILDFILGPLMYTGGYATNQAAPYAVEDNVVLLFNTPGGVPGAATWNFASRVKEDVIVLSGTEGRVSLSTFGSEPVVLETGDGREEFDLPNPPHIQQPLIQTIVNTLRGTGECPSTGETALRTQQLMDYALESYYDGRDHAFWVHPETWAGRRE